MEKFFGIMKSKLKGMGPVQYRAHAHQSAKKYWFNFKGHCNVDRLVS